MKRTMNQRLMIILAMVILGAALFVGGCSKPETEGKDTSNSTKPIKLTFATSQPGNHYISQLNELWIKKIKEETNGRVEITHFPSGTLVNQDSSYQELLQGVADIVLVPIAMVPGSFKINQTLPYFFYGTDVPGARKIWGELSAKFPELAGEFNEVKRLYSFIPGEGVIITKKPVRTMEDFKGLEVLPAMLFPELAGQVGATGTMIPITDLYSSLEKGIIKGAFMSVDALQSFKLADVTNNTTSLDLAAPPGYWVMMNKASWDRLPPDIQKIFEDSIPLMEEEAEKALLKNEQEAIDFGKTKGHNFNEFSPEDQNKFNRIMEQLAKKKAAELDAQGLPGTKIFQETRLLVEKYSK